MLCLSRRLGETIHVGEIVIAVLKIDGNQVRIGIDAPREINVRRGELEKQAKPKVIANHTAMKPKRKKLTANDALNAMLEREGK